MCSLPPFTWISEETTIKVLTELLTVSYSRALHHYQTMSVVEVCKPLN